MATYRPEPVILDCDDVLLDWQSSFRPWYENMSGHDLDPGGPRSYSLAHWLGLPEVTTATLIETFNASPHFSGLDAMPGAAAAISRLREAGHPLYVVTSCGSESNVIAARRRNLEIRFGDVFSAIHCLPLGASKVPTLADLPRGIWVEDSFHHAVAGHDTGHKAFLMRRSHNWFHEDTSPREIEWINDWHPILRYALSFTF